MNVVKAGKILVGVGAFLSAVLVAVPAHAYFYQVPDAEPAPATPVRKALPTPPVAKKTQVTNHFILRKGLSLKDNLMNWGKQSGWTIQWFMDGDIPNIAVQADFGTNFKAAMLAVQKELRRQNLRLHLSFWSGDSVVVIRQSVM